MKLAALTLALAAPVLAQNGSVFYASQYAGADASVQTNHCIAAAAAAGGGTCDASIFTGVHLMSQQINVCPSDNNNNPIHLILPVAGTWEWGLTDGVSCGIKQCSGASISSPATLGSGGAHLVLKPSSPSTNMDSLYCTDPHAPGDGWGYYYASGFSAKNVDGNIGPRVMFVHGLIHIQKFYDQSTWRYIGAQNAYGDAWHIDSGCCGASFDHINASASQASGVPQATQGGIPLTIGTGTWIPSASIKSGSNVLTASQTNLTSAYIGMYINVLGGAGIPPGTTVTAVTPSTLTMSASASATATGLSLLLNASNGSGPGVAGVSFRDMSVNAPEIGLPHLLLMGAYSTTSLSFSNVYMENTGTDTTTPFIFLSPDMSGIWFSNVWARAKGNPATKYAIESHTTRPWGLLGLTTPAGINDFTNGTSHIIHPAGPAKIPQFLNIASWTNTAP